MAAAPLARQWALRNGVALMLLFVAGSVATAAAEEEGTGSCEDVRKLPASQRCAFVRTNCEADSRIPYQEWYYCKVEPAGVLAKLGFMVGCFCRGGLQAPCH